MHWDYSLTRRAVLKIAIGATAGSLVAPTSADAGTKSGVQAVRTSGRARTLTLSAPSGGDDTPAIQSALNAVADLGGGRVLLAYNSRYLLRASGLVNVLLPSGSTEGQAFGLRLPASVFLDLNSSTLVLDNGTTNYHGIINGQPDDASQPDYDLGLGNGIIDANNVIQVGCQTITLAHVRGACLQNLEVINWQRCAVATWNGSTSRYHNVTANQGSGNGFMLGQPQPGMGERAGVWGALSAASTSPWVNNPFNYPGNPMYLAASGTNIESLTSSYCSAGVKIGSPSKGLKIGRVGIQHNSTSNSGLKLQGTPTDVVSDVTIANVNSGYCAGSGLLVDSNCSNITIGCYTGRNNAQLYDVPDVWLAGASTRINSLTSSGAGRGGVLVRDNAVDYSLDKVVIENCGRISGKSSPQSVGFSQTAGGGEVGQLSVTDSHIASTIERGLQITGGKSSLNSCQIYGVKTPLALYAGTDVHVGGPRLSMIDEPGGTVTPSAGATQTVVLNGNLVASPTQVASIGLNCSDVTARWLLGATYKCGQGLLQIDHLPADGNAALLWRLLSYDSPPPPPTAVEVNSSR